MKVAVVGASGFVGGHVLRLLRAWGGDVRAVVRNPRALDGDPDRRVADALDVYALRHAFAGCDLVVHAVLGAQDVILGSLAPVYAASEAVGVRRVIYMSTGVVHGQSPEPGTDESTPLHAHHASAYNNAKVRAEWKLRRIRRRGTVEIVMLRPTIVFGPRSRWVDGFAATLRNNTAYRVDGARGICNTIYIDNLVHAVRLALVAPGIDGEAFLVGDAETVSWSDLCRPLAAALGHDFDALPDFSPPIVQPGFKQRYVEPFRTSEVGQAILARVPGALKTGVRRTLRLAHRALVVPASRTPSSDAASIASSVSQEMSELHRCRWKLPHDKAARLLGYVPPVSFVEGCLRSAEWLARSERDAPALQKAV